MAEPRGLTEIAGAISRFWEGGRGPTHSIISTAFALAEYDEPDTGAALTKQQRVLSAIRRSPEHVGRRLVEELLDVLRTARAFDDAEPATIQVAQRAFSRSGHLLDDRGFVDWGDTSPHEDAPNVSALHQPEPAPPINGLDTEGIPSSIPSLALLISCLRRLASASPALTERRHGHQGIVISDEYGVQDLAEFLLRTLYNDVRSEERTPSSAGSSSTMDFLIKDIGTAVEIKVTYKNRKRSDIKKEILTDINDYAKHRDVKNMVFVIYDIAARIRNPSELQDDLSRSYDGITVQVVVVGWPLPFQETSLDGS